MACKIVEVRVTKDRNSKRVNPNGTQKQKEYYRIKRDSRAWDFINDNVEVEDAKQAWSKLDRL